MVQVRVQRGVLLLTPPLGSSAATFWPLANKHVLWGWKRDVGKNNRVVYYSSYLEEMAEGIAAVDHYFFYKLHAPKPEIDKVRSLLEAAAGDISSTIGSVKIKRHDAKENGYEILSFQIGSPTASDKDRVRRLQLRRPNNKYLRATPFPSEANWAELESLFPADLYAGAGVSYEAGLPTMREMHDFFCVDDHERGNFMAGANDLLPRWLLEDAQSVFRNFCSVHTLALTAEPTPAQKIIGSLYRGGVLKQIYSDNVDNMLCKVNVPFLKTRGSGVFNERFETTFSADAKSLIVIGVAADRRQLIQQARQQKKKVVVVNPCMQVAPCVQHLNYVQSRDYFYKVPAHDFFQKIVHSGIFALH